MKRILLALIVAMTFCSLACAQKQVTISTDSVDKAKVTVRKAVKEKSNADSSSVTVVGVDATDSVNMDEEDSSATTRTSLSIHADEDSFPFSAFGTAMGGGILISIIAILAVFGMPVFILFLVFFFRYKNRKARYRLMEQALAAGQPLPEAFLKENKQSDQRSQGIRNTFTGIGLFIFLWGITDEFGIGAIGLLIMFMGLGQWLIGRKSDVKVNDIEKTSMEEKTNENQ